jgi:hypothetical protein
MSDTLPPLPEGRRFKSQIGVWYTADQVQACIAAAVIAERAQMLADLRTLHDQQQGRHNYFGYAAELLSGTPRPITSQPAPAQALVGAAEGS